MEVANGRAQKQNRLAFHNEIAKRLFDAEPDDVKEAARKYAIWYQDHCTDDEYREDDSDEPDDEEEKDPNEIKAQAYLR